MRTVSRRTRIGLLLGVPFAALVAGSWWVSRALAFPGPELPSFRDRAKASEYTLPLEQILVRASPLSERAGPTMVRHQVYELGDDFVAEVSAVQQDLRSLGAGTSAPPDPRRAWSEASPTGRRGWRILLAVETGKLEIDPDHVVLTYDSWRPRTWMDDLSGWFRERFPRGR